MFQHVERSPFVRHKGHAQQRALGFGRLYTKGIIVHNSQCVHDGQIIVQEGTMFVLVFALVDTTLSNHGRVWALKVLGT